MDDKYIGRKVMVITHLPARTGTVVEYNPMSKYPLGVAVDGAELAKPVFYGLGEVLWDTT